MFLLAEKLMKISPATIDRLLGDEMKKLKRFVSIYPTSSKVSTAITTGSLSIINSGTGQKNNITFIRSRVYHKNDNCFVEQKNDMAVRRTVGYYRFDTEQEFEALEEVYTYLCYLLNFYYPSVCLIEKTRIGARINKVYDEPKRLVDKYIAELIHLYDQKKQEQLFREKENS